MCYAATIPDPTPRAHHFSAPTVSGSYNTQNLPYRYDQTPYVTSAYGTTAKPDIQQTPSHPYYQSTQSTDNLLGVRMEQTSEAVKHLIPRVPAPREVIDLGTDINGTASNGPHTESNQIFPWMRRMHLGW